MKKMGRIKRKKEFLVIGKNKTHSIHDKCETCFDLAQNEFITNSIKKELINLYSNYLKETVQKRTIMMTEMDIKSPNFGKQIPREMKGSFNGFIDWLKENERRS